MANLEQSGKLFKIMQYLQSAKELAAALCSVIELSDRLITSKTDAAPETKREISLFYRTAALALIRVHRLIRLTLVGSGNR